MDNLPIRPTIEDTTAHINLICTTLDRPGVIRHLEAILNTLREHDLHYNGRTFISQRTLNDNLVGDLNLNSQDGQDPNDQDQESNAQETNEQVPNQQVPNDQGPSLHAAPPRGRQSNNNIQSINKLRILREQPLHAKENEESPKPPLVLSTVDENSVPLSSRSASELYRTYLKYEKRKKDMRYIKYLLAVNIYRMYLDQNELGEKQFALSLMVGLEDTGSNAIGPVRLGGKLHEVLDGLSLTTDWLAHPKILDFSFSNVNVKPIREVFSPEQ